MSDTPSPASDLLRLSLPMTVSVPVEISAGDVLRNLPDDRLQAECVRRGLLATDEVSPLSGANIRGARGLLDWSLARLAEASGVSVSTLKRMEDGSEGITRPSKAEAVRAALEYGGVRFVAFTARPAFTWRRVPG